MSLPPKASSIIPSTLRDRPWTPSSNPSRRRRRSQRATSSAADTRTNRVTTISRWSFVCAKKKKIERSLRGVLYVLRSSLNAVHGLLFSQKNRVERTRNRFVSYSSRTRQRARERVNTRTQCYCMLFYSVCTVRGCRPLILFADGTTTHTPNARTVV